MPPHRAFGVGLTGARSAPPGTTDEPADAVATTISPRIPRAQLEELRQLIGRSERDLGAMLREWAKTIKSGVSTRGAPAVATALLLSDLADQGWLIDSRSGELWIEPPRADQGPGESVEQVKARVRAAMQVARSAQLSEPSVRSFIQHMERKRPHAGKRVSVLNLVDDGAALATELARVAAIPMEERESALASIVRPVIQVATLDSVCEHTGLGLLDVWRYFRHTWSLEYRPTPGRTLWVLIRNAARPYAPVMGIGAIASALPQLKVRDAWIGWTTREVLESLQRDPAGWPNQRKAILTTLKRAAKSIRSDDLLRRTGDADGPELERRLWLLAKEAKKKRTESLERRQERLQRGEEVGSLKKMPRTADGQVDWAKASETPLFVRKRAQVLGDVIFAERVLRDSPTRPDEVELTEEFKRALGIGLREIRKVGLASRLMDVNVCGAAQPYRDLLAGKLVALALATEDIRTAYRERYRYQVGEIASQMAGREVVRKSDVCVLTTTSLYGVAASQYNRLRIDVQTAAGATRLEWRDLGLTGGFGTVHLSDETVRALRTCSVASAGGRNVNNIFGEGNSPRLRQVREGLEAIGLDADVILRHNSPRRVYCVELTPGARAALRRNEATRDVAPSFADVSAAWTRRWLARRIEDVQVLRRVAAVGPQTVHEELQPAALPALPLFARADRATRSEIARSMMKSQGQQSNVELVRSLYRAVSACADHHDTATVDHLHIPTHVDEFIVAKAKAGGVVFVTGNPGDGKTHLIRRLEPQLRDAGCEIILDANEQEDSSLIAAVDTAMKRRKSGLVVAINEGILVAVCRAAGQRAWAEQAARQVLKPLAYRPTDGTPAERVTVVDLSLRNNLGPTVVAAALRRLLDLSAPCTGCPVESCTLQVNAARLGDAGVVQRLTTMLARVSQSGFHATMRDLLGLLSFMLVGGRGCDDMRVSSDFERPYWVSAFDGGVGPLFDAIRTLDPRDHTLPLLDDRLWRFDERGDDWTLPFSDELTSTGDLEDRRSSFVSRKRRALFEHKDGEGILSAVGSVQERFSCRLFVERAVVAAEVVELLNRFYDRDERNTDLLSLWVTHRYDARPTRYAAAASTIPTTDLEVLVPRLRPDLREAFPDFVPDHAVLVKRGEPPESGLKLDRALLEVLFEAQHGVPTTFRRKEAEARIAAFYDRLAAHAKSLVGELIDVRLVDMDTGANLTTRVDTAGKRYV